MQSKIYTGDFKDSELVIGLVGPVGTELRKVCRILKERLSRSFNYKVNEIYISKDIIPVLVDLGDINFNRDEFKRINSLMDAGNKARKLSKDNSVLALGAAAKIGEGRSEKKPYRGRVAYLINSLKRPEEVEKLRSIYEEGFFLIGVFSEEDQRRKYLNVDQRISDDNTSHLIERDTDENLEYGQRTRDTFHLSDFFVHINGGEDKLKNDLWRVLDLSFGHPFTTPTFDEYAMFMAFAASLRSADLSRQVGAVIAKDHDILSSGANDIPEYGGGLYWPSYDETSKKIIDKPNGRDYVRGYDSNKKETDNIIEDILSVLKFQETDKSSAISALQQSKIQNITEYGRAVHAEMEALLSCGRKNLSAVGATLYCTTFPCHNCAKHIISSGIKEVYYIEPYERSKAFTFHDDSISLGLSAKKDNTVSFKPFVGVGPRRFFDLFSIKLGSGYPLKRKLENGRIVGWKPDNSMLRIPLQPFSYLERESTATKHFNSYQEEIDKNDEKK